MENKYLPKAIRLGDQSAHEQHHLFWSRRNFLRTLGLTSGGSMLMGNQTVQAMNMANALFEAQSDRKLVIIRQKGGNDGLNMVIPDFDYSTYKGKRPTIAIAQSNTWKLNDKFSMPNSTIALKNSWDSGKMKVINSVGYPNQNLSHFRSSDIWDSASDSNVEDDSGWLGRMLDNCFPDFAVNPPAYPPAIQIGNAGSILFNNETDTRLAFSVANADLLFQVATKGELYDTQDVPECLFGEQLSFIRTIANQTFKYAEIIQEAYNQSDSNSDYGGFNQLAQSLSLVARLIRGGLPTQVYMVTIDGHDTHAQQNQRHPALMRDLANSVKGFFEDLAQDGKDSEVLCCTTSEFGRRIEQNASGGTDHGAAAPVILFGEGLNGNAVLGKDPDLINTDQADNLIYGTDFRSIYATLLEYWLCLSPILVDQLLGQNFSRLDELGIQCAPTTHNKEVFIEGFSHEPRYSSYGDVLIYVELPSITDVQIDLYSLDGKSLSTLFHDHQIMGIQAISLDEIRRRLSPGIYVYRIRAYGYAWSKKIRII